MQLLCLTLRPCSKVYPQRIFQMIENVTRITQHWILAPSTLAVPALFSLQDTYVFYFINQSSVIEEAISVSEAVTTQSRVSFTKPCFLRHAITWMISSVPHKSFLCSLAFSPPPIWFLLWKSSITYVAIMPLMDKCSIRLLWVTNVCFPLQICLRKSYETKSFLFLFICLFHPNGNGEERHLLHKRHKRQSYSFLNYLCLFPPHLLLCVSLVILTTFKKINK